MRSGCFHAHAHGFGSCAPSLRPGCLRRGRRRLHRSLAFRLRARCRLWERCDHPPAACRPGRSSAGALGRLMDRFIDRSARELSSAATCSFPSAASPVEADSPPRLDPSALSTPALRVCVPARPRLCHGVLHHAKLLSRDSGTYSTALLGAHALCGTPSIPTGVAGVRAGCARRLRRVHARNADVPDARETCRAIHDRHGDDGPRHAP